MPEQADPGRRATALARRLLEGFHAQRDLTRQGAIVHVAVLETDELTRALNELVDIERGLEP